VLRATSEDGLCPKWGGYHRQPPPIFQFFFFLKKN